MATTKITSPDFFNLESLNTALKLPSGTTAQRPTSPSTGEWRYNTTTNLVEFGDVGLSAVVPLGNFKAVFKLSKLNKSGDVIFVVAISVI